MLRLGSIRASRLAVQNSCAFATASTGSHSFLTIQPTFTVKDWALAEPVMADFVQRTQTEKGCMYYGWSTCGEKLFCREAYVDAVAVLDHLENIAESVGKMLDGPATLDKIELHGPLAELAKCKDAMDPLGCEYWEVDQGFSCMSKLAGASQTPQSLVTIQPTFCIKDWAAAAPIMEDFTARTASETGCVYYGWTKREGKLFCREAYVDAAGIAAHLENVGPCIGMLLDEKVATLDSIQLHGPAQELEKMKAGMDALGTTYWPIHSGFQKFET